MYVCIPHSHAFISVKNKRWYCCAQGLLAPVYHYIFAHHCKSFHALSIDLKILGYQFHGLIVNCVVFHHDPCWVFKNTAISCCCSMNHSWPGFTVVAFLAWASDVLLRDVNMELTQLLPHKPVNSLCVFVENLTVAFNLQYLQCFFKWHLGNNILFKM